MAPTSRVYDRYHELMPDDANKQIETLKGRTVSATTQLSTANTAHEFIDAKIMQLTSQIKLDKEVKGCFVNAKKRKVPCIEEIDEEVGKIEEHVEKAERELLLLKRQRKAITDDVKEGKVAYSTMAEAYCSAITSKFMSASKPTKSKFDQHSYAKGVLEFYGASRKTSDDELEKYCHITGWQAPSTVECAHIVPKYLESEELSYLYGVRETMLSEPRNGITFNSVIKDGLDKGWIVIVPDKSLEGEEITWRCILVEQSRGSSIICPGRKWRDIDGKALKFLTPNRPAHRYMYLRYVMAYIHQLQLGNTEWHDRISVREHLWATTGQYLRKSMLQVLASHISDGYVPEAFFESTFQSAEGCKERSTEEEEDLVLGFHYKLKDLDGFYDGDDTESLDDWEHEGDEE